MNRHNRLASGQRASIWMLAALLLLPLSAFAEEQQKVYRLELLVFEHLAGDDRIETWPTGPMRELDRPLQDVSLLDLNAEDDAWLLIDEAEHELGAHSYSLRRSSDYKVLWHQAWLQPGVPEAEAPAVDLRPVPADSIQLGLQNASQNVGQISGLEPQDVKVLRGTGLQGTVQLYLSRYLHVNLHLALIEAAPRVINRSPGGSSAIDNASFNPATTPTAGTDFGNSAANPSIGTTPSIAEPQFRAYWLSESRKLQLDTLQYFDNPRIGALLSVKRWEPETSDTEGAEPTAAGN